MIQIALKADRHRPAKRHFNCGSLEGQRWPNICWLGSFSIFQGIGTSIAKKPQVLEPWYLLLIQYTNKYKAKL